MGEMADELIDNMFDMMWIDDAWVDEEYRRQCRYCEEDGLHWEQTKAGWRLFTDDGEIHLCQIGVASTDDFEDVSL